jgi:hypothetical protein
MAWEQMAGVGPVVQVASGGRIRFSPAAWNVLGAPDLLSLFYDAEGGRLGFQKVGANSACLPVLADEKGEYYQIYAEAELTAAGILPGESYVADLQEPAPPSPPSDPGDEGIFWITIPEEE